jgi:hypothetical protein
MPYPLPNEPENEFVARCMGDSESVRDFPNAQQRIAFCYSVWESENEEPSREEGTNGKS